jgi:Tn3 transposase DDE domain
VLSAIILWNTIYLSPVVESLRAEGHDLPDHIIRHVSPQIWEHINLTGIYDWRGEAQQKGIFRLCWAQPKRNYVAPPEEGRTMESMVLVCSLTHSLQELETHDCMNFRYQSSGQTLRWPFQVKARAIEIIPPTGITVDVSDGVALSLQQATESVYRLLTLPPPTSSVANWCRFSMSSPSIAPASPLSGPKAGEEART